MSKNIGLDLGVSTIKAVDITADKSGKLVMNNAYVLPTPPDVLVDGTIIDYSELSEQISKVIESGGFQTRDVALAIKGSNTIAKKAKVPFMTKEQLERDLRFMTDQYMKVDLEEFAVDYSIIDVDRNSAFAQVVFAAIRKDSLSDYVAVMESAQLTPVVVNVEAFALCDLYTFMKLPKDNISLIAHIGHASTQLIFLDKGLFSHQEASPSSGSYCTNLIVSLAGIPADKAELVKITPDAFPDGDAAKKVMADNFVPDFVRSIEQAISNYRVLGGLPPSRIYLSGGGATTFGLEKALKEELEMNVSVMNPNSDIEIRSSIAKQVAEIKPAVFNVAIGMALR